MRKILNGRIKKVAVCFLLLTATAFMAAALSVNPVGVFADSGEAVVTGVSYGESGLNVLIFTLSGTDYPAIDGSDDTTYNYRVSYDKLSATSFFDKITVDGRTLADIYDGTDGNSTNYYINFFQRRGTFALHLPGYAGDADIKKIVVQDGCRFPAYSDTDGYYTVSGAYGFVKQDGAWVYKTEYVTSETEVSAVSFGAWGLNYLVITLDGTDYPDLYVEDKTLHNFKVSESVIASLDFLDKIRIDGKTLKEVYAENADDTYRDYVLNLFEFPGTVAFPLPGHTDKSVISEIVIEKGCQFPSYDYVKNGGKAKCFQTDKEIIGVKGTDTNYTLFEECDDTKPAVLDDSISAAVTKDGYAFEIRFNRTGVRPTDEDVSERIGGLVKINGVTLSEINAEKKYATAKWSYIGGRYYLILGLSKEYDGAAAVVNEELFFAGNTVSIDGELVLPSGEKAENDFVLHLYRTNCITEIVDSELVEENVFVENVSAGYDGNGDFNIWITFSEEISAGTRLFLASPDSFGKTQLKPMNNTSIVYYDDELAKNFISGGYKSALLDKILVNGVTLGEWLAADGTPGYLTAVMVHYGQVTQKTMSIVCDMADDKSWATDIFDSATAAYKNGTLTVSVLSGMRFPTGKIVTQDADYVYSGGKWQTLKEDFGVYYAGGKVENGGEVLTETPADENAIYVKGNGVYTFASERTGNTVVFTVYDGEESIFSFTVRETVVEKKGGCSSSASGYFAVTASLSLIAAGVYVTIRRRNDA